MRFWSPLLSAATSLLVFYFTRRLFSATAGLWLVIAGERYARRSGDSEFARATLYPALEELMRFHRSGAPV